MRIPDNSSCAIDKPHAPCGNYRRLNARETCLAVNRRTSLACFRRTKHSTHERTCCDWSKEFPHHSTALHYCPPASLCAVALSSLARVSGTYSLPDEHKSLSRPPMVLVNIDTNYCPSPNNRVVELPASRVNTPHIATNGNMRNKM